MSGNYTEYWFILVVVVAALVRGVHEGMVMTMDFDRMHTYAYPCVRGHVWSRYYHGISPGRDVLVALVGVGVFWVAGATSWRDVVQLLPGLGLLSLGASEAAYSYARTKRMVYYRNGEPYEHFHFFSLWDHIFRGDSVYWFQAARVILGLILLTTGLYL